MKYQDVANEFPLITTGLNLIIKDIRFATLFLWYINFRGLSKAKVIVVEEQ